MIVKLIQNLEIKMESQINSFETKVEKMQESGLPFLSPEDLPDRGLNPCLLHWQADALPLSHLGSPSTSMC